MLNPTIYWTLRARERGEVTLTRIAWALDETSGKYADGYAEMARGWAKLAFHAANLALRKDGAQ